MPISASAYQSPTIFGAIAPTTANMLAEAGANLTKQIEEQNVKLEAQLKAPAIGQIYADSLTRIAKGDFDGFKGIAEATAQGAGNPFLMSIFKDFDSAATRLAQSHMEAKFTESRQLVQERMASERLASSERQTDARLGVQESGQNNRLAVSMDGQNDAIYRQAMSQYASKVAEMDNDYQKEVLRVQKHNEGENEIVKYQEGYKPQLLDEPPKPVYPKEPEKPERTIINGVRPSAGRGRFAGPIEPDGQLFGASAQSLDEVSDPELPPLPVKSEQPSDQQAAAQLTSPNGQTVSPVGAQPPAVEEIVNDSVSKNPSETGNQYDEAVQYASKLDSIKAVKNREVVYSKKENIITVPFGNHSATITLPKEEGQAKLSTVTVKTSTGEKTFKFPDSSNDKVTSAKEFTEAVYTLDQAYPEFSQWASEQWANGRKVDVSGTTGAVSGEGKEKKIQPISVGKDGSITYWSSEKTTEEKKLTGDKISISPAGSAIGNPKFLSAEAVELYKTVASAKGRGDVKINPPVRKEDLNGPNIPDAPEGVDRKAHDELFLNVWSNKSLSPKQKKEQYDQGIKTLVNDSKTKSPEAIVEKRLEEVGVKSPDKIKQDSEDKGKGEERRLEVVKKLKRRYEIQNAIGRLKQQYATKPTDSIYQYMKSLQEEDYKLALEEEELKKKGFK